MRCHCTYMYDFEIPLYIHTRLCYFRGLEVWLKVFWILSSDLRHYSSGKSNQANQEDELIQFHSCIGSYLCIYFQFIGSKRVDRTCLF
jgi:hypothetical protein